MYKRQSQRGFELSEEQLNNQGTITGTDLHIGHGTVTLASITSCTNTSNPSVLIAAGLVAKKAVEKGLKVKPWVKTSLAPGSRVVTEYLQAAGLQEYLEQIGFNTVGYGCMTCIGNSGPLPDPVVDAIQEGNLVAAAVLSGNRNFEGRINPHIKANYLASPPLVVAYALAGTVVGDIVNDPIGQDESGQDVFLRDIWPSNAEIQQIYDAAISAEMFKKIYDGIESSNEQWNAIPITEGDLFDWKENSTYIQNPPFFEDIAGGAREISGITGARALVKVGDSVTTDHISPAGSFKADTPAGRFLMKMGVEPKDFNSYGSRRGNDRVMTRGTFANIRLKNQLAPGTEGGLTTDYTTGEVTSIFDAAQHYKAAGTPLVVFAGKDYGMGSSRDWAAKGTFLLGVKAVIAESYERIHRSNLVGMGVLPLQFINGENADNLGIRGDETFTIKLPADLKPRQNVTLEVTDKEGNTRKLIVQCRIDTPVEIDYYKNGGILQTVLRSILARSKAEVQA